MSGREVKERMERMMRDSVNGGTSKLFMQAVDDGRAVCCLVMEGEGRAFKGEDTE